MRRTPLRSDASKPSEQLLLVRTERLHVEVKELPCNGQVRRPLGEPRPGQKDNCQSAPDVAIKTVAHQGYQRLVGLDRRLPSARLGRTTGTLVAWIFASATWSSSTLAPCP